MPNEDAFHSKPWQVDWFVPELEHRKYAKAFREPEDYSESANLYFGDVHKHTNLSPCGRVQPYNQSPQESYAHARDVAGCDFLAICDHAEHMTPGQWEACMALCADYTDPGRFVAWPAVEWATPLYGHRNLYFRDNRAPLISGREVTSPPRLWQRLREIETPALTIPHHSARELPADMTRTDPAFEPAMEIFSGWGNEEYYGAPMQDTDHSFTRNFAVDTLLRGFHLGFVGGGDGHPAPPADSGITGIYASELSLPALFDALARRRTIATTGAKIRVDLHVNGFPIGSVVRFGPEDIDAVFPLEIGVAVQGTASIEKVEIVENGATVYTKTKPRARLDQMAFRWFRESGPTDGARRIGTKTTVTRFIYARVTQRDGHMAWTSPIWFEYVFPE
jgi:hypothetical protein